MQEGTLPERIYGLTVADGRRTVRPFESVRLCFRVCNVRATATPAGRAIFSIPPGWTAIDPTELDLPALDMGEERVLAVAARAAGAGDASFGAFQVALVLPEGTLGSNIVRIAVRGRPRFDGVRSALRLEAGDTADTIRAVVDLVNEGDATAHDVRVEIPPPPGFAAAADACTYAAGDIAPGAAVTCSLTFRAHAPSAATVHVDDARVVFAGGHDPLTAEGALALEPHLLSPAVTLERVATRLEMTMRLRNSGVVAAVAAVAQVAPPSGWQVLRRATTLDGAPAATTLRGDALDVDVPLIPARGSVVVRLTATARTPRTAGTLRVAWGGHDVETAIPAIARRSVQLVARTSSAWAAPATPIAVEAVLWNDGETDETIALHEGGACVARRDLRAGSSALAAWCQTVPDDALPGDDLTFAIEGHAADGEVLATAAIAFRIIGGAAAQIDEDATPPDPLATRWEIPAAATPGEPFDVQLRCRFGADVIDASIRPVVTCARYVAGSTRVNGHAVVDGPAAPPLFAITGLPLHGIPAGSEIAIAWSLLADGSGDVRVAATVDADGTSHTSGAPHVAVQAPPPFLQRPDGLPFHIGAPTLWHPPIAAADVVQAIAPLRFGVRLDAARRATILRMLRGAQGGIVAHLPLLAALFPDVVDGRDSQLADALAHAGESVRSIYERLFVKLRIPAYDVGPYDLEDGATRAALAALLDGAARVVPVASEPFAELTVALDAAVLRDAQTRLTAAPLGGVDAVATVALLLPRTGNDPAAQALGAYASLLAHELDAARSLSHDAFAAYLRMHGVDALEATRADAIAALAAAEPELA